MVMPMVARTNHLVNIVFTCISRGGACGLSACHDACIGAEYLQNVVPGCGLRVRYLLLNPQAKD